METTTSTDNFLRSETELLLYQARKDKAERTKTLGEPIELVGKALDIHIRDGFAWMAENTTVIRKLNLETGKTAALYRGHTAPVTALAFTSAGSDGVMVSGSWDQSIRIWDMKTKEVISVTHKAHTDFVKTLLYIPKLHLLLSGASDKIVRFWDLSNPRSSEPLRSVGSISAHTRPVEAIAVDIHSASSATVFTGDTMGVIRAWQLEKESVADGELPRWRTSQKAEYTSHRTGIHEMVFSDGQVWAASSDETVQIHAYPPNPAPDDKPLATVTHPLAVRCLLSLACTPLAEPYLITGSGDVIRTYDLGSMREPELLSEVDAHWHDVTALRFWPRTVSNNDGRKVVEPWIVSTSLDGTIRKWKLAELLKPTKAAVQAPPPQPPADAPVSDLTEDEERELAELMGDD